jgi:type 1 glutamine amidotransferase/glucose/arabinose dehydrogenase
MRSIVLSLFLLGLMASGVHAQELTVDSSIGDGMVLQQDRPNPMSGRGTPGAWVDVVLVPGTAARTQVDASGRWTVEINPGPADERSRRLSVKSGEGRLEIADVMIGELWFCSGQSNMVWSVDGSDRADAFRAEADNSMIRMFTVGNTSAEEPREDLPGRWVVCSPETVGRFSAVAYHFGKQLQETLDVPIGLVNSSWGGSRVEAWMRPEALEASGPCGRSWQAKWQLALDELHADPAPFADSDVDDSDWIPGSIPGHVNAFGIEDGVDGIFWHRVPIQIPPAWKGQDLVISLGMIDDHDVTYFNGVEIGRTDGWQSPRRYEIPGELVRTGPNVLAIRCIDGSGPGGVHGDADTLYLHPKGRSDDRRSLAGPARLKLASQARDMPAQHRPSYLYNGMLHALRGVPFAGVIWYQGENNAIEKSDPQCYEVLLETMIADWRDALDEPDLPFYIVQLPNFRHAPSWNYARVRDAQRRVAQGDPQTGLAITMDLGEADNIHPGNKHDVGRRLAILVLPEVYDRPVGVKSGPLPLSATRSNGRVVIDFDTFGSDLDSMDHGVKLGGFEIAGTDGRFKPASAFILNKQRLQLVPAPGMVGAPTLVRYAWAGESRDRELGWSQLANTEGMPASPFELAVTRIAPGAVRGMPQADELEPGVSMRIYSVGRQLNSMVEPIPGTTPNVDELRATIDWRKDGDFGGLMDQFVVDVDGYLKVDEAGEYEFRMASDDGSMLLLDGERRIWIRGVHPVEKETVTLDLDAGLHPLRVLFFENAGGAYLTLEWRPPGSEDFEIIPASALRTEANVTRVIAPGFKTMDDGRGVVKPGDGVPLEDVHPSWSLETLHTPENNPMVGCMTFLPDGRLLIGTFEPKNNGVWLEEPNGKLHAISNWDSGDPELVEYEVFAEGVYHPLGLCVVDGDVYLAQRDEITRFTDDDGDGNYEGRETFAEGWTSDNYHHFTFGLKHHDDSLYASLSTSIGSPVELERGSIRGINGPNPANRGALMKIALEDGSIEYVSGGFRTPNGIMVDPSGNVFVCENQGAWMPASKINHARPGHFYGHYNESRAWSSMYPDGGVPALHSDQPLSPPAVWLPQNEAANSPTSMVMIEEGPFAGQMFLGELKMGGIRRVALEEIDGQQQGAVFRHTQGLEGGVNRLEWAPDGSLVVGCIGEQATWSWRGTRSGLQRLVPTGQSAFEFHSIDAEPDGFTVHFTEPVAPETAGNTELWSLDHWSYLPTPDYGGAKVNNKALQIDSATVAPDGRSVRLRLDGLEEGRVVRFHAPVKSAAGATIHSPDAWYTLNEIPGEADVAPLRNEMMVFSKTAGFRHGSIPAGIKCFEALGEELGLEVVATEDARSINDKQLSRCAVVVFLNTTGDILDLDQEAALERYVKGGGGWIGVHSAADTEYDWPFYGELVGAYFKTHPRIQNAVVKVEDREHPATRMLPGLWRRTDEWYVYRMSPRPNVRVLASLDESSYSGGGMDGDHPIAWCHEVGAGRSLYTGGGHTDASYEEKAFVDHLKGAIVWVKGAKETPPSAP